MGSVTFHRFLVMNPTNLSATSVLSWNSPTQPHTPSVNLTSLPICIFFDDQEYVTHVAQSSERSHWCSRHVCWMCWGPRLLSQKMSHLLTAAILSTLLCPLIAVKPPSNLLSRHLFLPMVPELVVAVEGGSKVSL